MAQFIEVKSANVSGIFQIVSNRGVCWQVQDDEGELFLVQKKQVVRGPWDETEEDDTPAPTSTPSVAAQLTAATAKPKPAPSTKERDPDLVTLKQLCFDLDLEPRIARRRLRGSIGTIGTGSRWEWKAGSDELNKVRALLAKPTTTEAE